MGSPKDRLIHSQIRILKQSDLLQCPHVIIVAEHYREDGTCRCNDPSHTCMADWGYVWNPDTNCWG